MPMRRETFAKRLEVERGDFAGPIEFLVAPRPFYPVEGTARFVDDGWPDTVTIASRDLRLTPFRMPTGNVWYFGRSAVGMMIADRMRKLAKARQLAISLLGTGVDMFAMDDQIFREIVREAEEHGWTDDHEKEVARHLERRTIQARFRARSAAEKRGGRRYAKRGLARRGRKTITLGSVRNPFYQQALAFVPGAGKVRVGQRCDEEMRMTPVPDWRERLTTPGWIAAVQLLEIVREVGATRTRTLNDRCVEEGGKCEEMTN
jgi:hypothetical protein